MREHLAARRDALTPWIAEKKQAETAKVDASFRQLFAVLDLADQASIAVRATEDKRFVHGALRLQADAGK